MLLPLAELGAGERMPGDGVDGRAEVSGRGGD
jgi:hypothetical protein